MTIDEIQLVLRQPYDTQRWLQLLHAMLPGTDIFGQAQSISVDHEVASRVSQLGRVRLHGGRQLAVLEIGVAGRVDITRNRVGLRNFVSRFIDQERAHGVLAVFDSTGPDYRFTFVAKESTLANDGTLITKETPTRRFTYVLGPNEPCRTPAQRFAALATKGSSATLEDVTDTFSVEKLNREFFETYKAHYQKFCDHLLDSNITGRAFDIKLKGLDDKARDLALKPVRDFVKKLLGRLVFLHFLQKKGWLGCPANTTNWKNGDPNFLKNFFNTAPAADKQRFHSRCLVPLFFDTLNHQRKGDLFSITGTRVPYLNGGLFERDFENVGQIDFPAELFHEVFKFFGQYNFTIDENDPDDHEIGIDPEMLGHIFENLLEDNKEKGAFYTPKAIVQYMCQESLISYLKRHLFKSSSTSEPISRSSVGHSSKEVRLERNQSNEVDAITREREQAVERLVRRKEVGDPADKHNWIRQNAKHIEKLLDEVKICDPAIGSGAFPIGLLQEIYWLKLSLDWTLDRAKAKRDIIQHSVYGVDIDAGAVEIARLRFWLALVVEETTPRPLPNLDYKIMQGNSLLESFEGIDLGNLTGKKRQTVQLLGTEQTELGFRTVSSELTIEFAEGKQQEIGKLIHDYFDQDDHDQKERLHRQIDKLVLGHIKYNLDLHEERTQAVLNNAWKELKRKQAVARGYEPTKKEAERIGELEKQLVEVDRKRDKLAELQEKPERPFFLWHLFFQDVFARGGFDIVIGNPPYIQLQDDQGALASKYEEIGFETFARMGDIYALFYERGREILQDGGHLCYITSNKWMRAGYGEKLRAFLAAKTQPKILIDFAGQKIFESATVDTNILLFQRGTCVTPVTLACVATAECRKNLSIFVEKHATRQFFRDSSSWVILSPIEKSIKEKIERLGMPLKNWDISINYGIKTGFNDAFIIDEVKRAEILANCKDTSERKRTDEIIRPILRGRDIKRYSYEWGNLYLIFVPWHFPLHKDENIVGASVQAESECQKQYPAIYHHLSKHKRELSARNKVEVNLRYEWYALQRWAANYWDDFSKPKIMWAETMRIRRESSERFPRFAYSSEPIFTDKTCFMAVGNDLKLVLAFLNSLVGRYQFSQTVAMMDSGGYLMQKIYLEQINIGKVDLRTKTQLVSLVEKIIDNKTVISNEDTENEIDALVYDFFEISKSEQAFLKETLTAPLERG